MCASEMGGDNVLKVYPNMQWWSLVYHSDCLSVYLSLLEDEEEDRSEGRGQLLKFQWNLQETCDYAIYKISNVLLFAQTFMPQNRGSCLMAQEFTLILSSHKREQMAIPWSSLVKEMRAESAQVVCCCVYGKRQSK